MNLLYLIIPIIVTVLVVGVKWLENFFLIKRSDTKSKIKKESRRVHYQEDHNSHLTKNTSSSFLWKSNADDKGIQNKLKRRVKTNGSHENKK